MTIEELKERHHNAASNPGEGASISVEEAGFAGPWCMLFPEILALVEASGEMRLLDCRCIGDCECFTPLVRFTIDRHKNALAAFNAKLASL